MQGKLDTLHIWSLVIMVLLMRLFLKKPVKKGKEVSFYKFTKCTAYIFNHIHYFLS